MIIYIDHGIIYYDNDISSIVSNDRIIEADSSVSLRTVQYSNRRGGWHGSNVKNVTHTTHNITNTTYNIIHYIHTSKLHYTDSTHKYTSLQSIALSIHYSTNYTIAIIPTANFQLPTTLSLGLHTTCNESTPQKPNLMNGFV